MVLSTYMNARDTLFEALKHDLTTGSPHVYLGTERLLSICQVRHYPPPRSPGLQNLGQLTSKANLQYPPVNLEESDGLSQACQVVIPQTHPEEKEIPTKINLPALKNLTKFSEKQGSSTQKKPFELPKDAVVVMIDEDEDLSMAGTGTNLEARKVEESDQIQPNKRMHEKVHRPKVKKRQHVSESAGQMKDARTPITRPVANSSLPLDPGVYCEACHWRYPNTYTEADKRRHADLSLVGECQKDTADFRKMQRELKRMQQKLEREDLMNGEDLDLKAKYGGIRVCPHCDKNLEGSWGQFKKSHIDECAAKNIDKELNKIVGESAMIPKKQVEPPKQPDPFAIKFTSLTKRKKAETTEKWL